MNLTQTQQNAKQAYLAKQRETMIARLIDSDKEERIAIIKQIDSFLPVTRHNEEKTFWLKFRYQLERLNEKNGGQK